MPLRHVLVVACRNAGSERLCAALLDHASAGAVEFTLLMPAPGSADDAGALLRVAVERLRAGGLDIAGQLGEPDPCDAVAEVWDPGEYDEIVVATLPPGQSNWLAAGVPDAIARLTGREVTHLIATAAEH